MCMPVRKLGMTATKGSAGIGFSISARRSNFCWLLLICFGSLIEYGLILFDNPSCGAWDWLQYIVVFWQQNYQMLHQHNHSTLLGYQRRAVYYPPDGTGRDNYIRTDNGGTNTAYRCQGVPELGNFMKFGPVNRGFRPASYTRFQKYASDGSGRDKYVVAGHGGQYNQQEENSALLIKFRNTMRDGGWKKEPRNTAADFCRPSQIKSELEMSRTQSLNNRRLSEPKRRSVNYLEKLGEMRKTFHKN